MNHFIEQTEQFVKEGMAAYDSGHDWWHIERVRKLALYINSEESIADPFILEIAVLVHDVADSKFAVENIKDGYEKVRVFLDDIGLETISGQVTDIIRNVSFSNKNPSGNIADPVLLILQDADKLDAMGAIGIARAFNYGGFRNNPIYVPGEILNNSGKSTIGHFYDKLLNLKGMMNTSTGRRLAEERHKFLEIFLEQFYREWNFE